MPLISCVMTTFNASRYLRPAVQSILAQTLGDFELIVVDDGSTDDTVAILNELAADDARMKVLPREHRGIVQTALDGISHAKGTYLARMDSDDIAKPGRFAEQVACFESDDRIVLVGGAYELIDERGRLLRRIDAPLDHEALLDHCLAGSTPICQPLAMMRLDAYHRVGGYREEFEPAEDIDLWLRLAEVGRLACVPGLLLQYRLHANSVSEKKQHIQLANMRRAAQEAQQRRGVSREIVALEPWRPTGRENRQKFTLQYGWWAFNSGQWKTAAIYGCKAIAQGPLSVSSWKLLVCAIVKPVPRRAA